MAESNYSERVRSAGGKVVSAGKTVVHEGNVRRLMIRNRNDEVVVELPLTVGVIGAVVAPFAAVAGAVAALATRCTIDIEHVPEPMVPPEAAGEPSSSVDTGDAAVAAQGAVMADAAAQSADDATTGEALPAEESETPPTAP